MCLFFTEDMFVLKQMRKNLKAKIRGVIDKFGPEMFEDFDQMRVVKHKGSISSETNLLSLVDHFQINRWRKISTRIHQCHVGEHHNGLALRGAQRQ
jgi:hypothetical protein